MLRAAAAAYTCTLDGYSQAGNAGNQDSIGKMGRRHPYFSPALSKLSHQLSLGYVQGGI